MRIRKNSLYGHLSHSEDFAEYANKIINGILTFTWPKTKSWQILKISERHRKFQGY